MTHSYAHDCTWQDFFSTLSDQEIADQYAMRLGYCVRPDLPYRYQQWNGGKVYTLVGLPTRDEMIAEILQQEGL